jgi:glycerol uptake facilitator-like aquaporin
VWLAELVGTALLLTAVVGSGIMGERLAGGNVAIALLANSIATGCALYAIVEAVATFGLILVVRLMAPKGVTQVAGAVALYITAAYWFTASTSFANPAVTIARSLTDSFAGIRAADAPGFIVAQGAGALMGYLISGLWRERGAST